MSTTDDHTPQSPGPPSLPPKGVRRADAEDILSPEHHAPRAYRASSHLGKLFGSTAMHVLLTIMALTLVLPFVWMVLTSLKPLEEVNSDNWIPQEFQEREVSEFRDYEAWNNYKILFGIDPDEEDTAALKERSWPEATSDTGKLLWAAFTGKDQAEKDIQYRGLHYVRWYWNSLFVATAVTFLQVLTSSLAAFSFARLKWPGRDKVFLLYLSTMMLPGLVMMIPNYQIMITLGLVDTYWGLIIPAAFTAFGTFLLRQFMLTIPSSLDEAAEIDGASKWRLFWDVILPLSRPGLITLTIFTFIGNYQSFFWPLVMLKTTHRYTLPVGLLFFDSSQGQQTNVLMAAITLSVIPMIILFILLQKYLVKGIQLGAVKG